MTNAWFEENLFQVSIELSSMVSLFRRGANSSLTAFDVFLKGWRMLYVSVRGDLG